MFITEMLPLGALPEYVVHRLVRAPAKLAYWVVGLVGLVERVLGGDSTSKDSA